MSVKDSHIQNKNINTFVAVVQMSWKCIEHASKTKHGLGKYLRTSCPSALIIKRSICMSVRRRDKLNIKMEFVEK